MEEGSGVVRVVAGWEVVAMAVAGSGAARVGEGLGVVRVVVGSAAREERGAGGSA